MAAAVGTGAGGNNVYFVGGVPKPSLEFVPGSVYIVSHPLAHPLRFSATPDGTHGGGVEYAAGVTVTSTSTTIAVTSSTPNPLYYYCATHAGMGGVVSTRPASAAGASATTDTAATATATGAGGAALATNRAQKMITVRRTAFR